MNNCWTIQGTIIFSTMLLGCSHIPERKVNSICSLQVLGAAANGTHVRITAVFLTDGMESSVLLDPACPGVVVTPILAEQSKRDVESIERFEDEIWGVLGDTTRKEFLYEVSGVFRWQSEKRTPGSFHVEKIWKFRRIEVEDTRKADIP